MGLLDSIFGGSKKESKPESITEMQPNSSLGTTTLDYYPGNGGYYGASYPIVSKKFDGEKTPGELGVVIKNLPDYMRLRLRGLDAYVKTDTIKLLTNRRTQWVIGSGLKIS